MILFFDTETTGKADFKSKPDAERQPRLVQFAGILTDELGGEISSVNLIVNPKQFEIPKEASDVHGITTEFAREVGVPLLHVLNVFHSFVKTCGLTVCHNTPFDNFIMTGECLRMSVDFPMRTSFCTMNAMTPICNLPGPYGPKWPRLQEAFTHCFGKPFEGAHDALADVRACKDIYFWLKTNKEKAVA